MSTSAEDSERSSSNSILETENLTKRFGGLTAVDSVSYSLASEGIQCIIGPNGAGKSTFFKLITGRLSPTEGTIRYRGEDITDLEPYERVRRGLSMKFQDVSVYPELSVKENFRIAVQRHTNDYEDAIDDLLDIVQLQGKRDAMVGSLSHGQQQWLEIGMATAIEPDLLLLDEPTAGMTVNETEETGELIQSLADEGMAIIVVEHDINFVRQIAETVTVLHNGEIFTEGSVEEIEGDEEVKRIYLGEE